MNLSDILDEFAQQQIQKIQALILASDKSASGRFANSLDYEITLDANNLLYTVDFSAADHERYIRDGRRKGARMPPSAPIQAWMRIRGIPLKYEFPIKKGIAEQGIKPFPYSDTVFNDQTIDELSDSIIEFIQEGITEKLTTNKEIK
jgi:hypothetical protein